MIMAKRKDENVVTTEINGNIEDIVAEFHILVNHLLDVTAYTEGMLLHHMTSLVADRKKKEAQKDATCKN